VGFRGTPAKGEPIVDASELCPDEQRSGWRGYPIVCYPGGPDAGSTSPDAGGSGTGHPDAAQSGGDAGCPGAAENLRATLAGQWSGACGGDVLSWNISASGSFTGSNSNGQTATGTILADGSFSESGNGAGLGPFTAMGTITVAASCNAFTDSYSYMIGEGDGSNSCTAERSGADGG
jgi:hypothetical protein